MTSTAELLLFRKKSLVEERDKLARKTRKIAPGKNEMPYSEHICGELIRVWRAILKIDRELLRQGFSDLHCTGRRVTSRSLRSSRQSQW